MGVPTNIWDVNQPPDTQAANQLGLDLRNVRVDVQQRMAFQSDTLVNRWNPGTDAQPANWTGVLYFAIDTGQIFRWNGTAWVEIFVGTSRFSDTVLYTAVAGGGVVNTSGITIPASTLAVGNSLQVKAWGQASAGAGFGSNTFTINGAAVGTSVTFNGGSNYEQTMDILITGQVNNTQYSVLGFISGSSEAQYTGSMALNLANPIVIATKLTPPGAGLSVIQNGLFCLVS